MRAAGCRALGPEQDAVVGQRAAAGLSVKLVCRAHGLRATFVHHHKPQSPAFAASGIT